VVFIQKAGALLWTYRDAYFALEERRGDIDRNSYMIVMRGFAADALALIFLTRPRDARYAGMKKGAEGAFLRTI